jgi:hypothetical protein
VSFAAEHPVTCSRTDLGCTESLPGSKWAQMRAQRDGWFGQRDGTWFCPAHVPGWVEGWRARQPKMAVEHRKLPATAVCAGGDWKAEAPGVLPEDLDLLRDLARDHARRVKHEVLVTTSQETSYRVD